MGLRGLAFKVLAYSSKMAAKTVTSTSGQLLARPAFINSLRFSFGGILANATYGPDGISWFLTCLVYVVCQG